MDSEIELNYRLTGHLKENESVIATLLSARHGLYAATDQRILCLGNEKIGYRLRVHPYSGLHNVGCFEEEGSWFVRFASHSQELAVRSRSQKEAERFVEAVSCRVCASEGEAV